MEGVRLIYEQIEEAKRFLLAGSVLQLRLALILLDNAAELIMYRELQQRFAEKDAWTPKWEPARTHYLHSPLGPKWTEEERQAALKEFEPKTRILHYRLQSISQDDRIVLNVCHKLRCEAFHRGHVRRELLAPVTRLLHVTVCDLTVKLRFRSYMILGGDGSAEDRAFMGRFNIGRAHSLGDDGTIARMRDKLCENVPVDHGVLAQTLSDDLLQRIDETLGGLTYVMHAENDTEIDHNLKYQSFGGSGEHNWQRMACARLN